MTATLALLEKERPEAVLLGPNLQDGIATPIAHALVAIGVPFALLTGMDSSAIVVELSHMPRLTKPFGAEVLELGAPAPPSMEKL